MLHSCSTNVYFLLQEHLASLGVVHGDVACRNVYLDRRNTVKLSDFGLSVSQDGAYVRTITGRLPLRWMAIEAVTSSEFTTASDVWGFGITLWEITTLGMFHQSFPIH